MTTELSSLVRMRRLELSWSQTQLAEAAGVSLRTVQRLESGCPCSHETLLAIAGAFDLEVTELTRLIRQGGLNSGVEELRRKVIVVSGLAYMMLLGIVAFLASTAFEAPFAIPLVPRSRILLDAAEGYRQFLSAGGIVLALYLGVWAGVLGIWKRSMRTGLIALAAGIIVSMVAFSLLPWIVYEYDQYSPGFLWMVTGVAPGAIIWIFVTLFWHLFWRNPERLPSASGG